MGIPTADIRRARAVGQPEYIRRATLAQSITNNITKQEISAVFNFFKKEPQAAIVIK